MSPDTGYSGIFFGNNTLETYGQLAFDHVSNSFRFSNGGGSERMRITSAGNVGIGTTSPDAKLDVVGGILRNSSRVSPLDKYKYPLGHYNSSSNIFDIDPTWSQDELRAFFNNTGVAWVADADAPGGYAIEITGGVYVGAAYESGFPFIPIDTSGSYYMECYIKNVTAGNGHYMGGIDFNESFGSLGGNPGSYGYWVMSNTNPGTSWTKVSGTISGFGTSTGQFKAGTKYMMPMSLFNYSGTAAVGSRVTRISGWRMIRTDSPGSGFLPLSGGTMDSGAKISFDANNALGVSFFKSGGSLNLIIDSNNNTTTANFIIEKDTQTAGSGTELFRVQENGNVGIGTTNPVVSLQAGDGSTGTDNAIRAHHSDATYTEIRGYGLITNRGVAYIRPASDKNATLAVGNDANTWNSISLNSNTVSFNTDTSEHMRITSAGQVGIGTTAPAMSLDVQDNSTTWAARVLNENTSNGAGLIVRSDSTTATNYILAAYGNGGAGAGYKMVVQADGKVGIGTSSPSGQLDVSGDLWLNGDNVNSASYLRINRGGTSDGGILLYGNGSLDWQLVNNSSTRDLVFYSYAASSTVVRIQASTGNVGIGTTAPASKLHIASTGSPEVKIQDSDGTNQFLRVGHNGGNSFYISNDTTNDGGHIFSGSNGANVPTEKMRITSGGNVGIGTTSPQKVLDVAVSADSVVTVGASLMGVGKYAGIHFGFRENNTSYRKSAIVFERTDLLTGNAQGKVHILNGPQAGNGSATLADSKLTINEYGDVGIGVTAPASKLQVAGSVLISTTSGTPASGTNGLVIDHAATIGGGANSRFYSRGDATDRGGFQFNQLKNDNTGSRAVLTIDKDAVVTVAGALVSANLTIADAVYHQGDTNNYKQFGTDTQIFVTAGVEKMRITSGLSNAGFVGIGTTSPGAVNGTAFGGVLLHTKGSGNIGRLVLEGVVQGTMLMNASGSTANKRLKFMQAKSVNGASGGDAEFRMGKVTDSGTETTQVSIPDNGDMVIETAGQGLVLTSANGTQYRVTVSNIGQLGTTQI